MDCPLLSPPPKGEGETKFVVISQSFFLGQALRFNGITLLFWCVASLPTPAPPHQGREVTNVCLALQLSPPLPSVQVRGRLSPSGEGGNDCELLDEIPGHARNDDLTAGLSFHGLSRGQELWNPSSLPEGCAERGEGGDDLVAEGVGFFVFEVRVHAAELEGDCEGVESIGDAFAFVDIEEPVSFEIGATSGEDSRINFGERTIFFDEDGDVAAGGGISGNAVIGRDTGDLVLEGIKREFRHDGGSGKAG